MSSAFYICFADRFFFFPLRVSTFSELFQTIPFGFNTNVLETNILNLAVVWWVVLTVVVDSLNTLLADRKRRLNDVDVALRLKLDTLAKQKELFQKSVEEAQEQAKRIREKAVRDAVQAGALVTEQMENEWQQILERSNQAVQIARQRAKAAITKQTVQLVLRSVQTNLSSRLIPDDGSTSKQVALNEQYVRTVFPQLKRWSSRRRLNNS